MAVIARRTERDELLKLPDEHRLEIARALLASLVEHEGDDLDDEDRQRLHEELDRSDEDIRAGRVRPEHMILNELRDRASR
jgi:hypothetical protein